MLGGIVSPNLVRGRMRGYGLFITNKRVIGVKKPKAGVGFLIGAGLGGPVGGMISQRARKEEDEKVLQELDEKKDFDLRKEDISRIEFKKPGIVVGGHIIFSSRTAEPIRVKIGTKKDLDIMMNLMRNFLPDAMIGP